MMKRMLIAAAVLVVTVLPVFAEDAPPTEVKDAMPQTMPRHHEGMMKQMMRSPQHLLMMAYHRNLAAFGRALATVAQQAETVPREFARTAVAEMRRSVEEMEKYRAEAMKGMSAEVKGHGDMQKMMDEHLVQVKIHLRALEELTKGDRVASKEVMKDLQPILDGCQKMGRHLMPGKGKRCGEGRQCGEEPCREGMREHGEMMAGVLKRMKAGDVEMTKQVAQMKAAPRDRKLDLLADLVAQLVERHAAMTEHLEKMMQYHQKHEKESMLSVTMTASQGEGDDAGEDGDAGDDEDAQGAGE